MVEVEVLHGDHPPIPHLTEVPPIPHLTEVPPIQHLTEVHPIQHEAVMPHQLPPTDRHIQDFLPIPAAGPHRLGETTSMAAHLANMMIHQVVEVPLTQPGTNQGTEDQHMSVKAQESPPIPPMFLHIQHGTNLVTGVQHMNARAPGIPHTLLNHMNGNILGDLRTVLHLAMTELVDMADKHHKPHVKNPLHPPPLLLQVVQ